MSKDVEPELIGYRHPKYPIMNMNSHSLDFITLQVNGQNKAFRFDEIDYFQSFGNYVKIKTGQDFHCSLITTKKIEALLPSGKFIRIHKSYIVNKSKIISIDADSIVINSNRLPIGKTYKQLVRYSQQISRVNDYPVTGEIALVSAAI